jgi:protoporphyrinogen oxidase
VFFPDRNLFVPYPIQYHLSYLGRDVACRALHEIAESSCKATTGREATLDEWLIQKFGQTLWDEFFGPFHDLYTANLLDQIAPQDAFKSPLDYELAVRGAFDKTHIVGYNSRFAYPILGLDELAWKMAELGNVTFRKKVVKIDVDSKEAYFSDGSGKRYENLISTLPLNQVSQLAGVKAAGKEDPYTSVLVLNIGAVKGARCFKQQWVYVPQSSSGFYRVGAYSNVDPSFLPTSCRQTHIGLYVEKAYQGGNRPTEEEIQAYSQQAINELKSWGFIDKVEIVDAVWTEVAYTWSRPGSNWRAKVLSTLEQNDIFQAGRYAQWRFQGVLDSMRQGFSVGGTFRQISLSPR